MNDKKQKLLLEYLISSQDTYALCSPIIKAEYFDPEFRNAVSFVIDYYDKYHTTPSSDQIKAEADVALTYQTITKDKIDYCALEIERFCKRKAMERSVLAAPALMDKENFGEIERLYKEAVTISLNRDMGLDYFSEVDARLQRMLTSRKKQPTGWDDFDDLLFGGLVRGELAMFSANTGGGKSIVLQNLGLNFVQMGFNVLYISLELSEDLIAQRLDTMVTGFNTALVLESRKSEIAVKVEQAGSGAGKFFIKQMPAGTPTNTIRAYVKEFELKYGYAPDMLLVDYLDIMGTNEQVSADNVFEKDKRASEQLRNLLVEYKMFGGTASQQNRGAVNVSAEDLNQSHIAGGISKGNTVDVWASIILTDTMKTAGQIVFVFLKTRNSDGVGKKVHLKWINTSLRIVNEANNDPDKISFKKKDSENTIPVFVDQKSSILDLMQCK